MKANHDHDSDNDSDDERERDGVGTALSSYIRRLEDYPPLPSREARSQAQDLDVAKCPLYIALWLGGYNYLSKEYRAFVNIYYPALQGHIPPNGEDSHPDPLTLQNLHESFAKIASLVDLGVKRTPQPAPARKFTKAPAARAVPQAKLPISLVKREWLDLGSARNALPARAHAILTPAAIKEVTLNLQTKAAKYKSLRDVFALHNMRLVIHIASRHNHRNETYLMDFIQEGNKGLLRAIDRFCHWMGHKFSTYATWWIRQQISRYIQEHTNTIRIPSHITDLRNKMNRFCEGYYTDNTCEASNQVIADHFKITVKKVIDVRVLNPSVTSMDAPLSEGGESNADFASQLADPTAAAPEQGATMLFLVGRMKEVMTSLSPREQNVLQLRFGLGDGKQHTLQEVGRKLAITRERVRQIEQKSLKKLRHPQRLKVLNGEPVLSLKGKPPALSAKRA